MSDERVPFLDLVTVHQGLQDEFIDVLKTALSTAGFIGGPMVKGFEEDFAQVLRIAILRRGRQRYGCLAICFDCCRYTLW